MTITLVQDDTGPDLLATLYEDDGSATPIDLTDATVKFQMRKVNDRNYRVDADCEITDATAGKVKYLWAATDLDAAGDYLGQFQITFPDLKIQTTKTPIPITIRRQ